MNCGIYCTGCLVLYTLVDHNITWKSKLQTTIALSSTEADYVSLSQSMREVIPIMGLLDEIMHGKVSS